MGRVATRNGKNPAAHSPHEIISGGHPSSPASNAPQQQQQKQSRNTKLNARYFLTA